jgi:hypothetical protein
MKKVAMALAVLLAAGSLFAGGKECNMKKASAKKVELTGTLTCAGDDCEKTVFRVANGDRTYTVCEETKAELLKLRGEGTLKVKGKIVSCGEGEELMIESARKI